VCWAPKAGSARLRLRRRDFHMATEAVLESSRVWCGRWDLGCGMIADRESGRTELAERGDERWRKDICA
jgi:hypothetical protein